MMSNYLSLLPLRHVPPAFPNPPSPNPHPADLSVPNAAFEVLVKKLIQKMEEPATLCVRMVCVCVCVCVCPTRCVHLVCVCVCE